MIEIIEYLIERINKPVLKGSDIFTWASPVPFFGNIENATIASLGINPSNKEFVDNTDEELTGINRRFHTINSLELESWGKANKDDYLLIYKSCIEYFRNNPYDSWFKRLDKVLIESSYSYYFPYENLCHLDLVPYATNEKWINISTQEKLALLEESIDILGAILNCSNIKVLILNGQSVVNGLEKYSNSTFKKTAYPLLNMERKGDNVVRGYVYSGTIESVGTVRLKKEIKILGYNHNLQSSYGVSSRHSSELAKWIKQKIITYEKL